MLPQTDRFDNEVLQSRPGDDKMAPDRMVLNKRSSAILLALALILPATAADLELRKEAGGYRVLLRIDRNPPVIGTNRVEITVEDAAGSKVRDAKVLVNYYMPPMPRMAPMNYKVEARLRGREIRGEDEAHHVRAVDRRRQDHAGRQDDDGQVLDRRAVSEEPS